MSVLYVLLPAALLFAGAAVAVFVWAVRSGQFDDLVTPGLRILGEDDETKKDGPDSASMTDEREP